MNEAERLAALRIALRAVGAFCVIGIYPLTVLWPAGWSWHEGRSEYLEMIVAIYATLGVFLIGAAREPSQHTSLIAFAIWSSLVHGAVMAVQAVLDARHLHHLYGDVPALLLAAAVLGFLAPEALRLRFSTPQARPAPAAESTR